MDLQNLPKIGMGTFGSDKYDEITVANAVNTAIKLGYRMFDCASVYGNEDKIGEIFDKAIKDGIVKRDDLYITSKVWNDMHGDGKVIESCKKSLKDLKLDYIDLYFMHWPFPNYHAKGCSVDSRNKDSRPFFTQEFMAAWRQMETLKKQGLVKNIAMSNMTIAKFEEVLPLCEILPFAHEMELHPSFQQTQLFDYCVARNIVPIGYCPLGSPNRPERDRTPEDVADTQMQVIQEIAMARNCNPAEVCIAWAITRGQIPIPFASQEKNLISNLKVANELILTTEEMQKIAAADKGSRLVKGHVFLWDGAKDWTDLWDEDGTIQPWEYVNGTWLRKNN